MVYTQILMPEVGELARDVVRGVIDRAEEEGKLIEKENNPEAIIQLLRGRCDTLNYEILHKKVLEHEKELIPQIISMLVRSGNNVFIEHAAKILPRCKENYSADLLLILDDIRNPYALSLICIVLGFIGDEEVIPVIYHKYFELKKLYSTENYAQGPLLALYELNARYYVK